MKRSFTLRGASGILIKRRCTHVGNVRSRPAFARHCIEFRTRIRAMLEDANELFCHFASIGPIGQKLEQRFPKEDEQDLSIGQRHSNASLQGGRGRTESQMKTSHRNDDLKSSRVTPVGGNLFEDLGFSAQDAKGLLKDADARIAKAEKLKEEAATAIAQWMKAEMLTQAAAAQVLMVSRPRISDLVNFKLGCFSLDTLVAMLFRTGKNVELVVH